MTDRRGVRTVEIVLSPEDWEEMADVMGAETPDSVRERVLALQPETPFLVSDMGVDLVASSTQIRLDDLAPEPGGRWVVTDEAGNVVSRLDDWNDENQAHSHAA